MKDRQQWIWLLLFGSAWGIGEVAAGGTLYKANVAHASVWLSAWALCVLAMARGVLNKPGSSVVIGGVAALFRLVNAGPFVCHLLGIFALALAFDVAASLLLKDQRRSFYHSSLAGLLSAYGGYALFASTITYVVRYHFWTVEGLPKVLRHIFVGGSLAAAAGLVLVPLGYWVGRRGEALALRRPRWAYASALTVSAAFWALARVAG